MHKEKIVLFPFNGNAIEALDCINFEEYEMVGFIDDSKKQSDGYPVFSRDILQKFKEFKILAVPGSPTSFRKRKEIIDSLGVKDTSRFLTVIHPRATIGRDVKVGYNCLIMAGVVITSNAQVKNHVCVLPNTVIHHDVIVDDYTLIGSNVVIAGGALIGQNCYIGSGTNIMNGVSIGKASLVGLGSNVIKSVPEEAKMVGNPARDLNVYVIQ